MNRKSRRFLQFLCFGAAFFSLGVCVHREIWLWNHNNIDVTLTKMPAVVAFGSSELSERIAAADALIAAERKIDGVYGAGSFRSGIRKIVRDKASGRHLFHVSIPAAAGETNLLVSVSLSATPPSVAVEPAQEESAGSHGCIKVKLQS